MLLKNRLRLQPDKRLAFLQGFLRNPQLVGSVIPSSRFLERRLIDFSGIEQAALVVELGPGTGGTTRAILQALPRSSKLLAIEINRQFASLLAKERDPRLTVFSGSAENIGDALSENGLAQPEVVVSGIPFSTMPSKLGYKIISAVWDSLPPGGKFVAYQFRDRVAVLAKPLLGDPLVDVEFLNVPPMRFYGWEKPRTAKPKNGKKNHNGNGGISI